VATLSYTTSRDVIKRAEATNLMADIADDFERLTRPLKQVHG